MSDSRKAGFWWNGFFSLALIEVIILFLRFMWTHNEDGLAFTMVAGFAFFIGWFASLAGAMEE